MDGVTGLWPQALRSDVAAFPHLLWLVLLVGSELQRDPIRAIRPPRRARSEVSTTSVIITFTNWLIRRAGAGRVTERMFTVLSVSTFEEADGNQIRLRHHEAWVPRRREGLTAPVAMRFILPPAHVPLPGEQSGLPLGAFPHRLWNDAESTCG